jgi:hypothetical protein
MESIKESDKLAMKVSTLTTNMVHAIREELVDMPVNEEGFVPFEDESFEDDLNNRLIGVDDECVYFTEYFGNLETYPLSKLSFSDGIHILRILESTY